MKQMSDNQIKQEDKPKRKRKKKPLKKKNSTVPFRCLRVARNSDIFTEAMPIRPVMRVLAPQ